MRVRVAVPNDELLTPLFSSPPPADVELMLTSPEDCAQLLATNRVDVALLSPLAYGHAGATTEYRIIPASALALEGYTERVWLYFRPSVRTLRRCAVPSRTHFLTHALRLLLLELYDLDPELIVRPGQTVAQALTDADAVLSWHEDFSTLHRLDLSEEWYTAFEHPLVLGFWVCRGEELPAQLPDLLLQLAAPGLPEAEAVVECVEPRPTPALPARRGQLYWRWSTTLSEALHETLTLLYYHGLVPHLREVTLWNADSSS